MLLHLLLLRLLLLVLLLCRACMLIAALASATWLALQLLLLVWSMVSLQLMHVASSCCSCSLSTITISPGLMSTKTTICKPTSAAHAPACSAAACCTRYGTTPAQRPCSCSSSRHRG